MVRNRAPENLEIPGSVLARRPGMMAACGFELGNPPLIIG
jgi:hypothetical protein